MTKDTKIMLEYLEKMSIMEIYGFGKIVGAEEAPKFEDYITNILVNYNDFPRKTRRGILKLAKQVVEEAQEKKQKEEEKKN